jgi:broad specificity phosphatase PhoE
MLELPWNRLVSDGPILVLVRHGRTRWNAEKRFQGSGPDSDLPLDDVGLADVRSLGAHLGGGVFDAVVSSPMRRAQQTAEGLGPVSAIVPAVTEQHMGALEGMALPDGLSTYGPFFESWARDPGTARVPGGGESLGDVRDRALPALLELQQSRESGVVAVVTHQMVIAAVSCAIAGVPMHEYQDFTVPNLGLTVLVGRGEAGRRRLGLGPVAVDLLQTRVGSTR